MSEHEASFEEEKTPHVPGTHGSPVVERTQTFWIVIFFAILQTAVGVFVLYGNTQVSNVQAELKQAQKDQRAFIQCQAQYNQDFRTAYDAINGSARDVSQGLFEVISKIPGLLEEKTTQADVLRFKAAAQEYTRVYRELEQKRTSTEFPAPPDNFCGPQTK